MATEPDIRTSIRKFVVTNFYVSDQAELTDDASLFELGLVDSTGIFEILTFLQQAFGVEVADTEIVPENLDTLERITRFVERKKSC
jgi:acyl carrier protein